MKSKSLIAYSILALGLGVIAGCDNKTEILHMDKIDFEQPNYQVEYYNNMQFNAYYNKQEADLYLPNQGMYGSGNAFILRYNGTYYMYLGSSNYNGTAIGCYSSEDLMTWKQVNNGINPLGFCADDQRLYFTYPVVVAKYNNKFYMYVYVKNNIIEQATYILEADSPIGPFAFITEEDGSIKPYTINGTTLNIDGDIFIDDNEDVYFMSAHQDSYFSGIRAFKMPSMDKVAYGKNDYINIANSSVGGWTEGNGIIKRNGMYYLMYTGSNILSPGYLSHYSTALNDDWKKGFGTDNNLNTPGFEQGIDFPMGCETNDTFYSLGHANGLLGPDMDGIYYHYFSVNSSGPNATFGIDRLIFNGAAIDVNQTQYHSVKPKRPILYSYDPLNDEKFTLNNRRILSNDKSGDIFSAEFNYVGKDTKCIFSYHDENHYAYVEIDIANKKVNLHKVEDGVDSLVDTGAIIRDYDALDLHETVRVSYREGLIDVYFDDLKKIENCPLALKGGKIGYLYESDHFEAKYTAFSNVAKGLSDALEPKSSKLNIGAESFLPLNLYKGIGSSFSAGSGYSPIESDEYHGKHVGMGKMTLANIGDNASYLVDFEQTRNGNNSSGYYSLYMTLNKSMANKKIGVRIDGSEIYVLQVPEKINPTSEDALVKIEVGKLPIAKGIRNVSLINIGDDFSFHSFTFAKTNNSNVVYQTKLDKAPEKGMEQKTLWRFQKNENDQEASLFCKEGARSLVYFGDDSLTNYVAECDFRLNGESISTAGFIVEGNRYSNSPYYSEDYKYMQGYYISINKRILKIEKLNYTHTNSNADATRANVTPNSWFHIKITKMNNSILVLITDMSNQTVGELHFTDDIAFIGGRFGFYSAGASMSYKNLMITTK